MAIFGILWNEIIMRPMVNSLALLYDLLWDNFGLSIIVFTILIRFVLIPMTIRQTKQMKAMSGLQPQIKALQEKYKGKSREERAGLSRETMSLYKENGVNPIGCLGPMVIWKSRDCFHRGAVRFNLGPLAGKNIVGARLRWEGRGQCASRLFVVTSSWPNWNNPAGMELSDPWPANSAGPGELEVGPIVRDWTDGSLSNFGFLFAGPEEEERHGEKDIPLGLSLLEVCPSAVSGLELEVLYSG